MARRTAYALISLWGILLTGSALGAGMRTFTSEEAARKHCPSDTVVWLNTTNAVYVFKNDAWYGRTNRGAYVCKAEADKNGERASQNRQ